MAAKSTSGGQDSRRRAYCQCRRWQRRCRSGNCDGTAGAVAGLAFRPQPGKAVARADIEQAMGKAVAVAAADERGWRPPGARSRPAPAGPWRRSTPRALRGCRGAFVREIWREVWPGRTWITNGSAAKDGRRVDIRTRPNQCGICAAVSSADRRLLRIGAGNDRGEGRQVAESHAGHMSLGRRCRAGSQAPVRATTGT